MSDIINNILSISDNRLIKILLVILLALCAQMIVKNIVKGLLKIPLSNDVFPKHKRDREKRIRTLTGIATTATSLGIWFIAFILIMGILSIPIGPLLTSAGLIGAALAFGLQSLIKDFISGIFIIAENQYRVDDYIQLDKVSGKVEAITVRTTVLRDTDGSLHHVPNGMIGITTNASMGELHAREQFDIDPKTSQDQLIKVLQKIARDIADDPDASKYVKHGPEFVAITKITAKATTVIISFTTTAAKREHAASIVWEQLKESNLALA